jgi:predicted permease
MSSFRHALRSLRKNPGFTAVALLTLALCLGANLAIYAVVDAVLVRALPFPTPDRLVTLFNAYPGSGFGRSLTSLPNYFDRRGALPAIESLSLYQDANFIVGDTGAPQRVPSARITPEFFSTLGVPLAQGRAFTDAELTHQTAQVAILTDEFWRQHFNADPAVLGRTFLNDGLAVTVVGVLPPGFNYLAGRAQFFRPAAHAPEDRGMRYRHNNSWQMIARLAPGATLAQAQAQIDALNSRLLADDPSSAPFVRDAGFHTTVVPLHADHVRSVRLTLLLLQAGGAFLLIIGAVNLTNLLLIRASGRTKDLAVRQALGARRRHVATEVLCETLLLSAGGGILGCVLGSLGIDLLRLLGADRLPLGTQIAFDARVAGIGLAIACLLGIVLALPIIWFNLRARLASTLQTEGRGGTASRTVQGVRHSFIVAQIALAFVLLSSAGLLGLSLQRLLASAPGFSADHLLTGRVTLPWKAYQETGDRLAFVDRALSALRGLPGVTHAAVATGLPFTHQSSVSVVNVEGQPAAPGKPLPPHVLSWVSADYWPALRIPLLRGRFFEDADPQRGRRVCVVDQAFAEHYWPGADPIGRRISYSQDINITDENAITIVGVVGEVKQGDLAEPSGRGMVYFPPQGAFTFSVVIRTLLPSETLATAVRETFLAVDPGVPIDDLRPLQSRIDDSLVLRRSPAILAALFASVALLLAALGTYGVLAHAVSQHRREIGIRMALGARPRQIHVQFLRLGGRLLSAGLLLGLGGAWAAGRALSGLLYDTGPAPLGLLSLATALMAGVVFCAVFLPARQAAKVDPAETMRAE